MIFFVVGHITGIDMRESVDIYTLKPWFGKGSQHYKKTMVSVMVERKTGLDIREC
mgnify:CR=1 FL=1